MVDSLELTDRGWEGVRSDTGQKYLLDRLTFSAGHTHTHTYTLLEFVIWSVGFSLGGDAQRTRVWRHRGRHRDERFVVTRPEGLASLHLHPLCIPEMR